MADNPYVNKVQYGNQVLIDITDSTVEPNALLAGYKAYGADGAPVTGTLQLTYHITLHNAQYEALSDAVKEADENYFYIDDLDNVGVEMDDTVISASKVWSSQKVNSEIQNSGSGLIHKTQAEYDALPSEEKLDPTKDYLITDATLSGAPLDDDSISNGKVWSSQKVNNEIGALNSNIAQTDCVKVTADGIKTNSQLLNALYSLMDKTKINARSYILYSYAYANLIFSLVEYVPNSYYSFVLAQSPSAGARTQNFVLQSTNSAYTVATGTGRADYSTNVASSGEYFELHY